MITRIKIQNFLGISALDIKLESPILGVFGPNCSGKSSLAHALRFVLADDLCRVEHKKNIKSLIREGAKLGSVSVWLKGGSEPDYEYTRSAATGHMTSKWPLPTPHPALPYCLDPPSFVELDANARLSFLYYLMGVNRSAASITKLLEERGHAPAHIERIQTHLSGGFNAAHVEAQGIARELKGEWRGIAGREWGSVRAEGWSCEVPGVNESDVGRLRQDIAQYDEEIGALRTRHGALAERAAQCQRRGQRMVQTRGIAEGLETHQKAAAECREKVDSLMDNERKARLGVQEAEAKLTVQAHASQGTFFNCPACSAHLVYSIGECKVCEPIPPVDVPDAIAQAEANAKQARGHLSKICNQLVEAERELADATQAVARSAAADDALKDLNEPQDEGEEQCAAGIEEEVAVKTAARFAAQQALDQLEGAARQHHQAAADTQRAGALHAEIKAFTALAADLAPDGLPMELLGRALGPINERLNDSAVMTGWPAAGITTDGIHIARRPWALSSGSERWRANAMIGCAIAELSGIKTVVLDNGDILEPSERVRCIAWLSEIAGEMDTIILMMTLKAPPKNLPGAIQSVWLGEVELAAHALSGRS